MKKVIKFSLLLVLLGAFTACKSDADNVSKGSLTKEKQTSQSSTVSTIESSEVASDHLKVSLDDAINQYREIYPDTDITSIELNQSFGKHFYKIEGTDDQKEYEVRVDSETREVSQEREEVLDAEDQNGVKRSEDSLDLKDILGIEEISNIAEKQVGKGEAVEWKLDQDMGIMYWEVTVSEGYKDVEVKINAQSGEVLETSD